MNKLNRRNSMDGKQETDLFAVSGGSPPKRDKLDPIEILRRRLLSIGGVGVEIRIHQTLSDYDVAHLLSCGITWSGYRLKLQQMTARECHSNSIKLAKRHPTYILWTGLAMFKDGFWYTYSWVFSSRVGRIIETTVPRLIYFGYPIINICRRNNGFCACEANKVGNGKSSDRPNKKED